MAKKSGSKARVLAAAQQAGEDIRIVEMPDTTRTAAEAAAACHCQEGQIVKSLIFAGAETGSLKLLLVSGQHQVDLDAVAAIVGEKLERADPKQVRAETGFAIGGVAPIGHVNTIPTYMDIALLAYEKVWAAAGAPNAVFAIHPEKLKTMTGAKVLIVAASSGE